MRTFAFDGKRSLHSKVFVFVFDRTVAVVGSHNLDPLAKDVGSEILFASFNKQFADNTALQILFYDIIDPESGTIEYKIRKNAQGQWEGVPGHRPEDFLDQIESQKVYKIFEFLTNFEYLRDFS